VIGYGDRLTQRQILDATGMTLKVWGGDLAHWRLLGPKYTRERFASAEFGALHEQAMVETDRAVRDRIYRRMQDLMEESGAYVFLTHEVNAAV
jgi:ABC-type transport system substrate-binding protein